MTTLGKESCVFQTFSDKKGAGGGDPLARAVTGNVDNLLPDLSNLDEAGAGIFLQINEGPERGNQHITDVTALFVDTDGAPLEPILDAMPTPHILVQSSPDKYHVYWRVSDCPLDSFKEVQKRLANAFGTDPSVCDLSRVMRVPGSWHRKTDSPFQVEMVEDDLPPYPLAKIEAALKRVERISLPESIQTIFDELRNAQPGDRNNTLNRVAYACGQQSASLDTDPREELRKIAKSIGLDDGEINATIESGFTSGQGSPQRSVPEKGEEDLNDKHAIAMIEGKAVIINEGSDGAISFSSKADFNVATASMKPQPDPHNPNRTISAADAWIKSPFRRFYERVVFDPSEKCPVEHYNLWRGFAVEPSGNHEACQPFLDHIKNVICSGNDVHYNYLISWMADAVQNPGKRPGVAVVLLGGRGTGKGMFAKHFGSLFGGHYRQLVQPRHLTGNFNSHLKDALMVFADEAFWGGNVKEEGPLKALITEDQLMIEPKGVNSFAIQNHIHLIMATNNAWAVPAGIDERRFFCLEVSDSMKQDHEYFGALDEAMMNGGIEALLGFLLEWPLEGVNLRQVPQTDALKFQKDLSMSPLQRFWQQLLADGFLPGEEVGEELPWDDEPVSIATDELRILLKQFCQEHGITRTPSPAEVGKTLNQLCPGMTKTRPRTNNSKRKQHYTLPVLDECRYAFELAMGGAPIDWNAV
ncbi:hypothetical protein MAIT1_03185 [Magnetofaba australis IT-1]|uniref:Uncharacterized protein n=1 Tax=Magnetofaba australis IT-1 TaxID=1434232 RepID=A0A1Y2K5S2_9PROT|nr:hypothetical protein MAIT1_03185 [Magnetofaba australis IT-1]